MSEQDSTLEERVDLLERKVAQLKEWLETLQELVFEDHPTAG